jgi:hypothetical protein
VPTGDISPIIIIKTEYHRPSILSEREPEFGVVLSTNNIIPLLIPVLNLYARATLVPSQLGQCVMLGKPILCFWAEGTEP